MGEFRINQTVLIQKVIIADSLESAKREFEEQLDEECQIETFETSWSEVRGLSLEQEELNYIESIKEEEYEQKAD